VKVVWTLEALQDREAIWDYIAADNPLAAVRMDQLFSDCASGLADYPMLGHAGEVAGTRELTPHKSYRLVYEIVGDVVWILVLIHSARQWPPVGNFEVE
jgi:toxin ParE1/3/4